MPVLPQGHGSSALLRTVQFGGGGTRDRHTHSLEERSPLYQIMDAERHVFPDGGASYCYSSNDANETNETTTICVFRRFAWFFIVSFCIALAAFWDSSSWDFRLVYFISSSFYGSGRSRSKLWTHDHGAFDISTLFISNIWTGRRNGHGSNEWTDGFTNLFCLALIFVISIGSGVFPGGGPIAPISFCLLGTCSTL